MLGVEVQDDAVAMPFQCAVEVASKDFAVVQGISLVLVGAFVITNAVVDLLYAALDPRVALGSRAE